MSQPHNTHYQVATDAKFKHLVINVSHRGPYSHRPPLPKGEYWWRARIKGTYRGHRFVTPWSEVIHYHEGEPEAE